MWTKGVLLLIVFWSVVCNCEDGSIFDDEITDTLSKELAEDDLFRSYGKNKRDASAVPGPDYGVPPPEIPSVMNNDETDVCDPNPCENDGKCTKEGEKAKCICTGTFVGGKCETDVCNPNPCKNDGKCTKEGEEAKCTCTGTFVGGKCETDVCNPNPCKNAGQCTKDGEDAKCTCTGNFGGEKCERETCKDGGDCEHGTDCVAFGDYKFCNCTKGLSGDKCNIVDECVTGKFQNCKTEKGTCEYDEKGKKAHCKCSEKKVLDSVLNYCLECDCGENGKCSIANQAKICVCNKNFEEKEGKCEECNCGPNTTCSFVNGEKTCNFTGIYIVPCEEGDCQHGGECVDYGEHKFCKCRKGLSGHKCDIVDECLTGTFKKCKSENGTCEYDDNEGKAECICPVKKRLDSVLNYCLDCDCGENGQCSIAYRAKKCQCNTHFAEKDGKCEDCNCGIPGTCSFDKGKKVCKCPKSYKEDNGICKECDCGSSGKCNFTDGQKNCTCNKGYVVKDSDGKCHQCDCGTGGTCHFDGDTAECSCKVGYKEFNKKCIECDCGPNFDCELNEKGLKECNCGSGYAVRQGKCVETCEDHNDCKHGGQCKGPEEGDKFCSCNSQLEGDRCENIIECIRGKFQKCEESDGDCGFDGSKATCNCTEPKKLDPNLHICRTKCLTNEECKHGAECTGNLCKCLSGTEGDDCSKVTACDALKCEEKNAVCMYDASKIPNTYCVCSDPNYIFVEKEKRCVEKCKPENYCQNGGKCNTQTNLCECKIKTSGDKCEKLEGCDLLKCKDINAECAYDIKGEKATCNCNDNNYYYETGKCKPEWCRKGCKDKGSTCEYNNGVGVCKCTSPGTYYDYAAESCKKFDACFNKTCEGDLICSNGVCKCPENHKKKDDNKCEPEDLCLPNNKCFTGAQCEKGSSLGYVNCLCNSSYQFYLPRSGKCDDGSCFLPSADRKTCTKSCPPRMTRKDGECKHNDDKKNCDHDCGFRGWCEKINDSEHKCNCDPNYAEEDKTKKKCVLKASAVCPTNEKDGDNKCKCTGKYKPAKNDITCELKSCSDEDVQKECKNKGATKCVDNWKNDNGYKCVCPDGYIDDPKKGCIDPCSLDKAKDACSSNGQICYIGDKDKVGDCRCPPTFSYNENKISCDLSGDNTFMIHGLPVVSKKYKTTENNINKVTLNRDVSTSMKQAFANLDFVHVFSFKAEKDVLLCNVWLQFKSNLPNTFNATLEVRRWKTLTVEGQNQHLLPPQLLLSSNHISAVSEEELTLCTVSVQQSICGSGSTCSENKCSCRNGFREIESTIVASSKKRIVRCEDIDECTEGIHKCKDNSKCVNTLGDYVCKCNPGFKKAKGDADAMDKEECIGLCDPNPCGKGTCQLTKEKTVDCTCQAGYSGSFCNKADVNLAKASKATKVVGAVLGTLLGIVIILIIVYVVRQRKNSYSEDFAPAPRVDNAEMIERRPMRGVSNRAYQ